MDLTNLSFIRLSDDYQIKPFDCGDKDLNDFLLNNSILYLKQLLAVSYLLEEGDKTVAFFSLLNDKIGIQECKNERFWKKKFSKKIPYNKRRASYPAMKVGRLAIDYSFQKNGIGTIIIDYLKSLFISNNRTGCRFITVDAYRKSFKFYEKNGFEYLTDEDVDSDTRLMYFDLMKILP